MIIRKKLSKVI
uniref:Uncharacterized protein n=1 Tax=Rhizophora mucronata TaxID=61149 RepID=A0A2P2QG18_RHIMU